MSTTPTLCQGLQSGAHPLILELRVLMHPAPPIPLFAAEPEKAYYLHPFSNSFLGTKSLDMCTESLGTETGSGIDEYPHHHHTLIDSCGGLKKEAVAKAIKKVKCAGSFPPPLTSFSVIGGVQVHREGGRLVIKAFSASSSSCRFHEERGDGRLRLTLIRDGGDEEDEEIGDQENGFGGGGEEGGRVGCVIGGGEWSSSRCNGDRSSRERLKSLPFCVAIS